MGLSEDGLKRFAAVAASHVGDEKVPGLVALVACGDEVHVEALGTLAVGGRPVERTSLFRIASTTKPITAAATLALVREGLLGLDEPVDRLLPEFANRRVLRRMDGPLDDTSLGRSGDGSRLADLHVRVRDGHGDVHGRRPVADRGGGNGGGARHDRTAAA